MSLTFVTLRLSLSFVLNVDVNNFYLLCLTAVWLTFFISVLTQRMGGT
jgi:hypothetical protein